jgi:hypothetical protein
METSIDSTPSMLTPFRKASWMTVTIGPGRRRLQSMDRHGGQPFVECRCDFALFLLLYLPSRLSRYAGFVF